MYSSLFSVASVLTTVVSIAQAQQSAWGQCGGIGWTGATTCVSGYYCSVQNSYYSQCIPGAASTTIATSTKATTTAKPTSTAKPTTSSAAPTSAPAPSGIKYLISFGDSYSQTGYTTSGTQPSAQNPLGNPPFPGWATDNGPNWLGYYLTQYNKSVIYSYNFAYGGATTDASLAVPYEPTVLSFIDQTSEFSSSVAKKPSYAPWTSSNALFAIWMGVNDVGMDWSMSNWTTLVEEIMTRYFQQVQIMYNAGGRKFLFLTVPPTQRTPTMAQYGDPTDSNLAVAIGQYYDALKSYAASFKAANSGVTTYILDTSVPFNTALDNPSAYGAPDNTCFDSSGTKCLWWDNYHPGQAIQKLVAQAMVNLLGNW